MLRLPFVQELVVRFARKSLPANEKGSVFLTLPLSLAA
jgi:hypothetical protein